jgi:hypothetical protein
MDGQRLPGGVILLERELVKHRVVVRMGERQESREKAKAPSGGE